MLNKLALTKDQIQHRRLLGFAPIMFLWSVAEGMLIFFLPLFIEEQFNSLVLVGLLLGLNSLSSIGADLFFGMFSEVNDYRRFFYFSLLCEVGVTAIILAGGGWLGAILLVILWGARYELFLRFGSTMFLSKNSPRREFGAATAVFLALRSFGFFLGPLAADFLVKEGDVFVGLALLLLVSINMLWSIILFRSLKLRPRKVEYASILHEIEIVKQHSKKIIPYAALGFGIAAMESVFYVFGPIEFARRTDSPGLVMSVALLMLVFVPYLASMLLGGRKLKRVVIGFGFLVTALVFAYPFIDSYIGLLLVVALIFAVISVLWEINDSLFLRFIAGIRHEEEDEVVSINGLFTNLSYVVVAVVGGFLFEFIGFTAALIFAYACFVTGIGIFLHFKKNVRG